ncbi:MAG: hypothetical protein WD802_03335 [Gemmatimonadaceae bacterium]
MKRIALSAVAAGFVALTASANAITPANTGATGSVQACPAASAVATTYLRNQVAAGRKLTMTRANAIAEIAKLTGADGEFAGLRPCDAGYPNAVRFYLDEVIKAGTDNSTPGA